MILVNKPTDTPDKLSGDGQEENIINEIAYNEDQQAYIDNKKQFVIKPEIYNYPGIKASLKKAQHEKCCFCEKEQTDEYGAVEHYRPKAGYEDTQTGKLIKPGYYWLGYIWSNLYFVCGPCNTKKANLFPLSDEDKRVRSHHDRDKISQEDPYLLDPAGTKDPREHIAFDLLGYASGKSRYGKETIQACDLNRDALRDKRKKIFNNIDYHIGVLALEDIHPTITVEKSKSYLETCCKPEAEFSAAVADYLSTFNIHYIPR